jgi:TRAP transporter 4TM/12TM fusion protein
MRKTDSTSAEEGLLDNPIESYRPTRRPTFFEGAIKVSFVLYALTHLYVIWRLPFSLDELKVLHLGLASVLLFFLAASQSTAQKARQFWFWFSLGLLSLAVTAYFFVDYENMIERVGTPSTGDIALGTLFVSLVFLIAVRTWGYLVPCLSLATIVYGLYGSHLGGLFFHTGIDLSRLIGYCSTYYAGMLGGLTGLSASTILHFLLFGALLEALGGARFFEKLSAMICARFASGAAQTSVWSSALFGMISGSVAANVAVDGPHTIPMMKKRGYSADYAGAVEAAASTGGQIMPPVMGVAAFILASLVGITYGQVCVAALLPAFIYYGSLAFAIMIHSRKIGLTKIRRDPDVPEIRGKDLIRDHGHLLIPIGLLTWRLLIGESPARTVLYANLLLLALGLVHSVLFREESLGQSILQFGKQTYKGMFDGAREAAKLGIILGIMGIIVEMFTVTGFAQRLSYAVVDMAGGHSFLLVLMVAVLTIVFGMGMPTPGAYLLAVLLSAPVLIKFGFLELSAHMFVFYFAIVSALTPPVAIAILVATGISGGSYLKTALHAMRLAFPGFLLPFYFLYQPVVLALGTDPWHSIEYNFLLMMGIAGFTIFLEGCFLNRAGRLGRALCLLGALLIFHPSVLLSWIGFGVILVYALPHFILYRRQKSSAVSTLNAELGSGRSFGIQ